MSDFDAANATNPLFTVFRQYMRIVMEMFAFIQAVHSGDWKLHLIALELFTKYFFVHDKICYLRMIPLYLAEMASLESSDPEIYGEFITGNCVVNKNKEVPFCAVGGDTALEHLNRSMKVSGGLVGITFNESAQTKFFLIAPELARLTAEAKAMTGLVPERAHHQELNSAVLTHKDNRINTLTETIKTFSAFVQDRIKTGKINLWAPVKKRNLLTWKTSAKVIKVKAKDTIIDLKEDKNLVARLAMVCKSRPEIDIQEAVGLYEFTVVPRSLFARDGTMLHCSCKSALMHILEKAGGPSTNTQEITAGFKVAIVDGMAEVQSLDKPEWIKNCRDLVEHFTNRLLVKCNDLQELHIIFDRYDVPSSLKSATRVKRQGGHAPIYYRITDSTHIAKVPMKKLLAHSKTKGELTTFLAKNVKDNANGRQVVVAWGTICEATHRDVRHLRSTQEEADTKIILHALDASAQGATQLSIYSPDTDVLVLALRRYPDLCSNSCFVTGTGSSRRVINLKSIADALGPTKSAALPAFHALTGADVTGSFSGKGKATCWDEFDNASTPILQALANLDCGEQPDDGTRSGVEQLVCRMYQPKTDIKTVKALRWSLFKKNQAESERLPPTQAACHQAILIAHYQHLVWNNDLCSKPGVALTRRLWMAR